MPGKSAGPQAGRIQQHQVHRTNWRSSAIRDHDMFPATPSPAEILGQATGPMEAYLTGSDRPGPPSEGDGFSSRRGARVVDRGSRRRVYKPDQDCLGRVLHDEMTLTIAGKLGRAAPVAYDPGLERGGLDRNAGGAQCRGERLSFYPSRLYDQSRTPVIPLEQPLSFVPTEGSHPPSNQPGRVGILLGQGCRVAGGGELGRRIGPSEPTQYGVHEPGCADPAGGLRQSDTGVYRRVSRHPLQGSKLVRAHSQDVLQLRGNAVPTARHEWRELPVEHASLPEHSCRQLVGQPPVGLGQLPYAAIQRHLEGSPFPYLLQDPQGGATRSYSAHRGHLASRDNDLLQHAASRAGRHRHLASGHPPGQKRQTTSFDRAPHRTRHRDRILRLG